MYLLRGAICTGLSYMYMYMMVNVVGNEYFQSISTTEQSKLRESPEAGPRTRVEPINRFLSTADRCHGIFSFSEPCRSCR